MAIAILFDGFQSSDRLLSWKHMFRSMANRYSSALLVFISKVLKVWIDKRNIRSYLIVRSLSGRVSLVMGRAKKPKIYFLL